MVNVSAFTGGLNIASARFRVRQYVDHLRAYSINLCEYTAPLKSFPPETKWIRPFWAAASLCSRIPAVLRSHTQDVVLIQREMLSKFVTLEPFVGHPRILDVDDAIWIIRATFGPVD